MVVDLRYSSRVQIKHHGRKNDGITWSYQKGKETDQKGGKKREKEMTPQESKKLADAAVSLMPPGEKAEIQKSIYLLTKRRKSSLTHLLPKHLLFIKRFCVRGDWREAADLIQINRNQALYLLGQQMIQDEIFIHLERKAARTNINQDRVLKEYARLAFADIKSFILPNRKFVKYKDLPDIDEDDTAAISEIITNKDGEIIKYKLHSKKDALDSVGRSLGIFADKLKIEGGDTPLTIKVINYASVKDVIDSGDDNGD